MDPREEFHEQLDRSLRELGLDISPDARDLLWRHFLLLIDANSRFNLTRITDPRDAAVKHYADSLALVRWFDSQPPIADKSSIARIRILDLGTGGGFPAVPLAVVRPEWDIVAVDKTGKKARFVAECAEELRLSNLNALQARPPEWNPESRFDIVAVRAVATAQDCLSTVANLVRPGGWVVCYKTASMKEDEVNLAEEWCREHRWNFQSVFEYALHKDERAAMRRLVSYRAPN